MRAIILLSLIVLFTGCSREELDYFEVKRIDETISENELATFLRITRSLPEKKVPNLPAVFSPAPQWNPKRTLAVSELLKQERLLVERRWMIDTISRHWERNRALKSVLRRERMTLDQYVGMTLALGVAASRSRTPIQNSQLKPLVSRGGRALRGLSGDARAFSSLSADEQYEVLRLATWLTRQNRAAKLLQVPEANVVLARKHAEAIDGVLPAQFLADPIAAVVDPLSERGMPFLELPGEASDADLTWSRDDAVVGHDNVASRTARGGE